MDFTAQIAAVLKIDRAANAIEYRDVWYSWGELADQIDRIDAALHAAGIRVGARVGVILRNRPTHLAAVLAILTTGRCLVTLNPVLSDDYLAADIARLDLPVVLGQGEDLSRPGLLAAMQSAGTAGLELSVPMTGVQILPGLTSSTRQGGFRQAEGVAIEMLTSGTTGKPKRVPLLRRAFDASFENLLSFEKRSADEPVRLRDGVVVVVNPITHIGGIYGALRAVANGRKLCLLERFTVKDWHGAVRRHRPKVVPAVPAAIRMLLEADLPREDLSSLAMIICGTAPIDPETIDAFLTKYGIPVLPNYGATEFSGAVAGWSLADFRKHWQAKRGAAGRVHENVEARVVEPTSGAVLAPGEVGVLELRSPQLGDSQAWARTTDLAELDADGFLYIRGRADNAIIRGGFKIHPQDVVQALEAHPAIREAAVVALNDPRLGQVPVAALILQEGVEAPSTEVLIEFARARLAAYQVPVQFKFVEDLPRTASMKPILPKVAELFSEVA